MCFLRPNHKAKPLAGRPPKESYPPTQTRLLVDSKRSCSEGLGDPWPAMFLQVPIFLAQVTSLLGLFIWGLGWMFLSAPTEAFLSRRGGAYLKAFFPLWLKVGTFLLLALHPLPSSGLQVHTTTGAFCSLTMKWPPCLCNPQPKAHSMEKELNKEQEVSQVYSLLNILWQ